MRAVCIILACATVKMCTTAAPHSISDAAGSFHSPSPAQSSDPAANKVIDVISRREIEQTKADMEKATSGQDKEEVARAQQSVDENKQAAEKVREDAEKAENMENATTTKSGKATTQTTAHLLKHNADSPTPMVHTVGTNNSDDNKTSIPHSSWEDGGDENSMSGVAIAGILIGCFIGGFCLVALIYFVTNKAKAPAGTEAEIQPIDDQFKSYTGMDASAYSYEAHL